jgi:hypothetical protein
VVPDGRGRTLTWPGDTSERTATSNLPPGAACACHGLVLPCSGAFRESGGSDEMTPSVVKGLA